MAVEAYISIINLNINVLNTPIKRHTLAKWIHKISHCGHITLNASWKIWCLQYYSVEEAMEYFKPIGFKIFQKQWSYMHGSKGGTRHKEQTFGLSGRRPGWDDLRE